MSFPTMGHLLDRLRISDGCWEWTGTRGPTGYGSLSYRDDQGTPRTITAHRLAYLLLIGPIPEGFEVDHLCSNRGCVRPSHLEPVTPTENKRRKPRVKIDKDKFRAARIAAGLSQAGLAAKATLAFAEAGDIRGSVSESLVALIETDRRQPSLRNAEALAAALDIPLEALADVRPEVEAVA